MKKLPKTIKELDYHLQVIFTRFFTEMVFREIFDTSPTKAFKKIYGKKWEKQGAW